MFVRINQRVLNGGQQREVFFIFETDHENMAAIHAAMVKDGCLNGIRFETRNAGHQKRVVVDEFETIVFREGLVSIMEMQDDLFDDDGTPLWTFEADGQAKAGAA